MLHFKMLLLHRTLFEYQYTTSDRHNAMGVGLVFEADLATEEHISHIEYYRGCVYSSTQTNITITAHHLFLTKFQISFYGTDYYMCTIY